jgi:plasmid maintenance system antidote protein VapI
MARERINDPGLAELANTTRQQIHKLRHGDRKLTVQWAKRLAPHLKCTWQELVEETPTPVDQGRVDLLAAYDRMNAEERRAIVTLANGVAHRGNSEDPSPGAVDGTRKQRPARA